MFRQGVAFLLRAVRTVAVVMVAETVLEETKVGGRTPHARGTRLLFFLCEGRAVVFLCLALVRKLDQQASKTAASLRGVMQMSAFPGLGFSAALVWVLGPLVAWPEWGSSSSSSGIGLTLSDRSCPQPARGGMRTVNTRRMYHPVESWPF